MKFTNGYWLIKKEITPIYAVEYGYHRVDGNQLTIYAPSIPITNRGDCVNIPMMTVVFQSPQENIIQVKIVHFKGSVQQGPYYHLNNKDVHVEIEETEDQIIYTSGETSAVISKKQRDWKIEFFRSGKLLTESSYRNIAHMTNEKTDKSYVTEQLLLDVGEKIYGLGERFTPFVKNGQIVDMWNADGGTASEQAYKNLPFYVSNMVYL